MHHGSAIYHLEPEIAPEIVLNNPIKYRKASETHVPAMAGIRSKEWGTEEYWIARISGYLQGKLHPGDALPPRVLYIAVDDKKIIGFIAGHLSTRINCDSELEWINILSD